MPEASEQVSALQRIAAAPAAQPRWNTEVVRSAWSAVQRRRREAERAAHRSAGDLGDLRAEPAVVESEDPITYGWIEQLWTDHIVVRCGDNSDHAVRVSFTVDAPGTGPEHVRFGQPERVRMAYVAASRAGVESVQAAHDRASNLQDILELSQRRVRSMDGARRYRKPIGSPLGDGTTGRVAEATGKDAKTRPDQLRKDIKGLAARDKTYRGGKVFGDIGNKGKLKQALASIANLPDGKRGAAAAEIVLAAQALGMTSLVPMQVKRLYRAYLSQKPKKTGGEKKE